MKKMLLYCFVGLVLVGGTFFACSNKKESEAKKGTIEKMTDKTAKEIVDRIHAPIDKARSAAKQEEDRIKEMDDALKKQ
ncbi:MAG: hypothetical protein A2Y79_11415 [Deltaproteobacteria bacterium RBG_13_43_22]|nr:MAG: hypothetical protein A2Y79_11415 [Deltaproteobacteria bacterium RBG_13_43_22]